MGRTLTNTMLNLGIQNACDEALYQVIIPVCMFAYSLFVYETRNVFYLECNCSLISFSL